jgi:KDO2-lipid IV(A) lauroyltransferase
MLACGRALGRIAYRLAGTRRRIAAVNLGLCFPDQSAEAREALLRRHFESLGMGLLEMGWAWWAHDEHIAQLAEVEGLEHLDAALAQGKGCLMLSAPFTSLEVTGRLLSLHRPFAAMYRRNENPVVEHFLQRNRDLHTLSAIQRNDVKKTLRALKRNEPIWYAPDQGARGPNSVVAPFFDVPAGTNSGTPRLAKVSGAPVVPFFGFRLPGGRGYKLKIWPALEDFPSDDVLADLTQVNAVIERMIREAPEQYLWIHRRFKTFDSENDPYAGPAPG